MFVQVLRGRAIDDAGATRLLDRWLDELSHEAEGWTGTTAGITDDARFIASFGFDSPEAARQNSDRAEQTRWWMEFSGYLDTPRFWDCELVEEYKSGASKEAGFVQVVICRVLDPEDFRQAVQSMAAPPRNDVIGGVRAWHGSHFTEFVYFTSEEDARRGERSTAQEVELERIWPRTQDIEYLDLRSPWMAIP